jgi:hypothetical protein
LALVLIFHDGTGKGAWFIHYLALDIYYLPLDTYYLALDTYYLKGDEDNGS